MAATRQPAAKTARALPRAWIVAWGWRSGRGHVTASGLWNLRGARWGVLKARCAVSASCNVHRWSPRPAQGALECEGASHAAHGFCRIAQHRRAAKAASPGRLISGRAPLGVECTHCVSARLLGIRLARLHAVGVQGHRAPSLPSQLFQPAVCTPLVCGAPSICGAVAWARVTLLRRVWPMLRELHGGHQSVWATLGGARSQGCVLLWGSREWAGAAHVKLHGAPRVHPASSRQHRSVFASRQGWLAACVCARVCRAAPVRSLPRWSRTVRPVSLPILPVTLSPHPL